MNGLLKEVCLLLENTTSKRIKITEAYSRQPLWITGDIGTINHAILNLCINSIDAMPKGGTLTLRTALAGDDRVEVTVEDNGEGIPPELLGHVLEPFFTTKEVGKGTGLGLSMTYGVIKAHGGTMGITSEPGKGTTARLLFPRIPDPAQELPVAHPVLDLNALKVLLVDDEEEVRLLVPRMLEQAGVHQVEIVSGGQEAIESLQSGQIPDLIILDQNMPGMDGVRTLALIRDYYPDLPILISSGQPGIQDWQCFKQPRVAVISKPFSLEEILAKLAPFVLPG
jgi:CheY-like chemotaxis protein